MWSARKPSSHRRDLAAWSSAGAERSEHALSDCWGARLGIGHPPTRPCVAHAARSAPASLPSDSSANAGFLAARRSFTRECPVGIPRNLPIITLSAAASYAALDPGHLFNPASLVWSIAGGLPSNLRRGLRRPSARGARRFQRVRGNTGRPCSMPPAGRQHPPGARPPNTRCSRPPARARRRYRVGATQRLSYAAGSGFSICGCPAPISASRLGYVRAESQAFAMRSSSCRMGAGCGMPRSPWARMFAPTIWMRDDWQRRRGGRPAISRLRACVST